MAEVDRGVDARAGFPSPNLLEGGDQTLMI